jgi:hypothetical protein
MRVRISDNRKNTGGFKMSLSSEENDEFLTSVGGNRIALGRHPTVSRMWNFGYTGAPIDDPFLNAMPEFKIIGYEEDKKQAFLWDFSLQANGGKHFLTFRQETGSCVGNGLGQAIWYLSAVEVFRLKDPEQVLLPFWLLPYGKSRQIAGMRGQGEGSFGSAAAEAMRTEGILAADSEGLPPYTTTDGICFGSKTEMIWSDGAKIPEKFLTESRKHLVKTTSKIRNAGEAKAALKNYYPLTCASNFGTAQMVPPMVGSPGVKIAKRTDTWGHQMSCIGWMEHPQFGDLFYILNSWGPDAHGTEQTNFNEPPGGFWITSESMDYMCKDEVFAFSQFNGFPAQNFSWRL